MRDTRKYRYARDDWQAKIASYIHNKDKQPVFISSNLEDQMVRDGQNWYLSGRKLEEAELKLQKNRSFVVGYNKAAYREIVNKKFYEQGIKFAENGIQLCDIPADYINNPYFIAGYNETINSSKKKSGR